MGRFDHIAQEEPQASAQSADEFGCDHFLEQAGWELRRGRYEMALKAYGRALERDRARPEAWAGQARALLEMGQPREALTWLEQAVKVAGERPVFHALRAIASARLGKPEDALAWSDRAMRLGPDEPDVWLARAEALYLQAQATAARRCLDKAHEREPGSGAARRCGEVALGSGDLACARTWLERALARAPEDPLVALRLGVYWERVGDLARARVELQRALALEPGLTPASLALADLRDRGPLERARATLRRLFRGP